jgi:hypothetical protein
LATAENNVNGDGPVPVQAPAEDEIPGYRRRRVLGVGGMGTVYEARDRHDRRVAIKVIRKDLAGDPRFQQQFARETEAARQVVHPNVVRVLDANDGQDGGRAYLVMEYIEGRTIEDEIERHGRLPMNECVDIVGQIADALDAVHRHDLAHADVTARNVLLDSTRRPRRVLLADFGLAQRTTGNRLSGIDHWAGTGSPYGTPGYSAPEQDRGDLATRPTDIFQLATLFLHAFLGEKPTLGTDLRTALPDSIREVITRALSSDRESRYQNAGEFAADLRRAAGQHSRVTSPDIAGRAARRKDCGHDTPPTITRRGKLLLVILSLIVVLVAALGAVILSRSPSWPHDIVHFKDQDPDLYFIKTKNTGTGKVEIHSALARNYFDFSLCQHNPTRFDTTNDAWGQFQMAGEDLFFIKTRGTPSGNIEVRSATKATRYIAGQNDISNLSTAEADNGWFQMEDIDGDGRQDLVFIKTRNTPGNRVEVHWRTAASGFRSGVDQPTTFTTADDGNGWFQVVGTSLFFVKTNTASGKVEVHWRTFSSDFQTGSSVPTWFSTTDRNNGYFQMVGLDLLFIKTRSPNPAFRQVEIHSATAANNYRDGQHDTTWFSTADQSNGPFQAGTK